MNIKHHLSSPYHPQTNGLTERFNQTLCKTIAKYDSDHGNQWDTFLSSALFVYRTLQNSTTKYEPFQLLYGRQPILPGDLTNENYDQVNEIDHPEAVQTHIEYITEKLDKIRLQAKHNINEAQQKQKHHHDQKIKEITFKIGDKVLLYESAKAKVHGDKFREKWTGPYYIHEVLGLGAYKLRTIEGNVLKRTTNTERLKLYYERPLWEPIIYIE
jgi:hypothetical protein